MAYLGAGITRFNTADDLTVTGDAQIDTNSLVVDSTNNRVGILNASPATALDVVGNMTINGNIANTTGDFTLDVAGDIVLDADGAQIRFKDAGTEIGVISNSSNDLQIVSSVSDADMIFRGNDGGTPFNALTLDMSDAGKATFNSFGDFAGLRIGKDGSNDIYMATGNINYTAYNGDHVFKAASNAFTERMRLDSSGNLLVGKTSTGNTVGAELRASGYGSITRDGNVAFTVRRLTSDGTLMNFQKDTTEVGAIGTNAGYLTIGADGHSGLLFDDVSQQAIRPWNMGSNTSSDNTIDLGISTQRFKDLYLSGGAYLGGTGSANYLEDYEEGTWTPSTTNGTLNGTNTATYTKVGNLVTLQCYVQSISDTTTNSTFYIGGLPFSPAGSTYSVAGTLMIRYLDVSVSNEMNACTYLANGETSFRIFVSDAGGNYVQDKNTHFNNSSIGLRTVLQYQV